MSFAFSHFHPNPGWNSGNALPQTPRSTGWQQQPSEEQDATPGLETIGKHCILELYGCDPVKLDDEEFLRSAISNAALRSGATLLQLITHRFQPQGVTGLALLAESHISIHTWPESGYAAVDVFTCGEHTMPECACRVLVEELSSREHRLRSFRRETPGMLAGVERLPKLGDSTRATP